MPERARIPRHRLQKSLHEPFETVALIPLGKGYRAVLGEDIVEGGHGGGLLKTMGDIILSRNVQKENRKNGTENAGIF